MERRTKKTERRGDPSGNGFGQNRNSRSSGDTSGSQFHGSGETPLLDNSKPVHMKASEIVSVFVDDVMGPISRLRASIAMIKFGLIRTARGRPEDDGIAHILGQFKEAERLCIEAMDVAKKQRKAVNSRNPRKTDFPLNNTITSSLFEIISVPNIETDWEFAQEEHFVSADKEQIEEAFDDLFRETVKMIGEKDVRIRIALADVELSDENEVGLCGGRYVRTSLMIDAGIRGDISCFFDIYHALGKGEHLELTVIAHKIRKNGGGIIVRSNDRETTLSVYLPAPKEDEPEEDLIRLTTKE